MYMYKVHVRMVEQKFMVEQKGNKVIMIRDSLMSI